MSSCSSTLSGKSSRPSGRMSTSQPCRIAMSGIPLAQRARSLGLPLHAVERQVARGGRVRRVIGDRHVLVAERAARLDHRLDRVAAVAPRRVHVEIAADVAARRPASAARRGRRSAISSSPFRISGGMQRQAERRVDVRLGRPPGVRVPSLACRPSAFSVQPGRGGVRAQRLEVRARSGQVQQRRRRRSPAPAGGRRSARDRSAGTAGARCGAARATRSAGRAARRWRPPARSVGATISMSPTMSWPRRSDPTGIAHATPGAARSGSSIGSRDRRRRGRAGCAECARGASGSAAATAASTLGVEPGQRAQRLLADRVGQVGGGRGARAPGGSRASCSMRDGARLEQPAQIGRQVGDAPIRPAPSRRLRTSGGAASGFRGRCRPAGCRTAGRCRRRTRCCARARARARASSSAASATSPRIVASDASCSSVRWKGDTGVAAKSPGIGRLAFQCAGFGRRLLRAPLSFRSAGSRRASRRCRP